jgi:hypothetical protein
VKTADAKPGFILSIINRNFTMDRNVKFIIVRHILCGSAKDIQEVGYDMDGGWGILK